MTDSRLQSAGLPAVHPGFTEDVSHNGDDDGQDLLNVQLDVSDGGDDGGLEPTAGEFGFHV
jgi:hypothetical protein